MPPNSPDEVPTGQIDPSPVPQIIAQAAEMHRQEAERIGAQLLEAVQAGPPPAEITTQMVEELNQRDVAAAGIPPAGFGTPEEWDDDEDEYPTIQETPSVVEGTPVPLVEALQQLHEMNEEYQEVPSGFPAPDTGELIMTRGQLGRCRKPDIKTKRIRIISMRATEPPAPGWWAGFGLGYVDTKQAAAAFTYQQVMELSPSMADTFLYVDYAPAVPAAPVKDEPRRKSDWYTMLSRPLVDMICLSPKNGTFRARVMAVLKEPIPDDFVTADQIRDWVEFNFPRDPVANDTTLDLKFTMNYSHVEVGTCNYRRRARGSYTGKLSKEHLIELVMENPDSDFDQIMHMIRQDCDDMARRNGNAAYERIEETNHSGDDFTDHDSVMVTSLRGPVTSILREILPEEEVERLGI